MKVPALLLAATTAFAQPPSARLAFDSFEVATIKPTPRDWTGGRFMRMQTAQQFSARNYEFRILVSAAFSISPKAVIGGPAWVDSDHYDIVAKTPGEGLPNEVRPNLQEQMKMLRQLLEDRFKFTYHREPKEMTYYALTVAKNGPKLQESKLDPNATPEGPPPLVFVLSPQGARLPARYATMGEFAALLQRSALDRPVVDQTGLTGRYDFDIEWAPDETQFNGVFKPGNPDSPTKPSLSAAIQQQLGLRLDSAKGPVEAMVIDRAERPTEN